MSTSKTRNLDMDRERVTGARRVITSDHANIHAGEGFQLSLSAEAIADNGTLIIELTTPATKYAHVKQIIPWSEGGVASIDILEGNTSTGGSAATPVNKNRVLKTAATVTAKTGTTPADGTAIGPALLFGGGGPGGGAGGGATLDNEWVLDPETLYTFRVTNLAGSAKAMSLYLFWYEEDGA